MKRKVIFMIAILSSLSLSSMSNAFVGCQGKVTQVELRADGRVNINWGWGWRQVCNVSQDINAPDFPIKKEACVALYSQAITALTTGQQLASYHSHSQSCAQAMAVTGDSMPSEQPYGYVIGQ